MSFFVFAFFFSFRVFHVVYFTCVFLATEKGKIYIDTADKSIGDDPYARHNALYKDHCSHNFRRKNRRATGGCMCIYFSANIFFLTVAGKPRAKHASRVDFIQIASPYFRGSAAKIDVHRNTLQPTYPRMDFRLDSTRALSSRLR